jgi:type II secretory pathway component HofQ
MIRRLVAIFACAAALPLGAATVRRLSPGPEAVRRVERTVTLDVKDADVRVILRSMKTQCAVRNLIVDPDVQGKGTFLFREVPCSTAFRVVFRSLGLAAASEPNSVVMIGRR